MNPQPEAWMRHDGETIVEVNDAFLALFRISDSVAIIDRRVEEIIFDRDLRGLALFRGQYIRHDGRYDVDYEQEYEFMRFDGSCFWGKAISRRVDEMHYRTVVRFEYETRK
jgi:PAS domain-containing protein